MRTGWLWLWVGTFLLAPMPARGEDQELEAELFFTEDEVVTSPARHSQRIGMSPSAITVLTREDIEASGATTIGDLLRLVPGLDVMINTPGMLALAARLNWTGESNHLLVLIDGREANLELGITSLAIQPVFLEDIERIEVIRGPASALYGANALTGVIAITTRGVGEQSEAWLGVEAGERSRLATRGRITTRLGDLGFSLSGAFDHQGLFADPATTGRQIGKMRLLAEYRLSRSRRILLEGGYGRGSGAISSALSDFDAGMTLSTLRLAYEDESLRSQLYWAQGSLDADFNNALEFGGVRLATLVPLEASGDILDAELQWTLPTFWSPLLIIAGANGRFSLLSSDDLLDASSYPDRNSPRYHQPGIEHTEGRLGAFLHTELAPADWVTVTAGLRFDVNTVTGPSLSPRLASVFRPAAGQFVRLGVAQSYRKPAFFETHVHPMVAFPQDSPITGGGQEQFQEFMTQVLGNSRLDNERVLAFETGYLGRFLAGRLGVSVDLFYNIYSNEVALHSSMVAGEHGLPDLQQSRVQNLNEDLALRVAGGELVIRYAPHDDIVLRVCWTHRQPLNRATDASPKNLFSAGGRFRTRTGLLGSLYLFTRSEFWDRWVPNPGGLLEPFEQEHFDTSLLVTGRLGWRWRPTGSVELEAGLKIFLPVSTAGPSRFSYREIGGGTDGAGHNFGGDLLHRMLVGYLEGTF